MKKHWAERLSEGADLPGEMMPGVPVVELAGDRRVLIEGHGGVTEYSADRICVRVRYGAVSVVGCGLELTCMNGSQLVISGRIDEVQLFRRKI